MRPAIVCLFCLCSVFAYASGTENFLVRKPVPELTGPGNNNILVQNNHTTWWGYIRSSPDTQMPPDKTSMTLQFEFTTPNYFKESNKGHIAIGIRGDSYTGLLGRGIVIGNVSELPGNKATSQPHAIAIESFWIDGNHVYGKATESIVLQNDVLYRISVTSKGELAEVIGYELEKRIDGHWVSLANREIVDYEGLGKTSPSLGGWFILEVFSNHAWEFQINNVKVWYD